MDREAHVVELDLVGARLDAFLGELDRVVLRLDVRGIEPVDVDRLAGGRALEREAPVLRVLVGPRIVEARNAQEMRMPRQCAKRMARARSGIEGFAAAPVSTTIFAFDRIVDGALVVLRIEDDRVEAALRDLVERVDPLVRGERPRHEDARSVLSSGQPSFSSRGSSRHARDEAGDLDLRARRRATGSSSRSRARARPRCRSR